MRKLIYFILTFLFANSIYAQVIVIPIPVGLFGKGVVENGFLPGKKFPFYETIDSYNFNGLKLRVELFDDRDSLKLSKTECSKLNFTNTSEFAKPECIFKVSQYIDSMFNKSNITLDSNSIDTLQVRLEGIDARLIGGIYIRAHGLCQMQIKYRNVIKTYCVDITDADKHSPISSNAFVTRKTATRIIASASIREVIEQFLVDLKNLK